MASASVAPQSLQHVQVGSLFFWKLAMAISLKTTAEPEGGTLSSYDCPMLEVPRLPAWSGMEAVSEFRCDLTWPDLRTMGVSYSGQTKLITGICALSPLSGSRDPS